MVYKNIVFILGTDHLTWRGGVMVFSFVQNFFFFRQYELEYFFVSRLGGDFFPEFNISLYDKNSESDYFFFLHQNQNIFFSNIGNQNIFVEKNQKIFSHIWHNDFNVSNYVFFLLWYLWIKYFHLIYHLILTKINCKT